jgi:hypothetical protein
MNKRRQQPNLVQLKTNWLSKRKIEINVNIYKLHYFDASLIFFFGGAFITGAVSCLGDSSTGDFSRGDKVFSPVGDFLPPLPLGALAIFSWAIFS